MGRIEPLCIALRFVELNHFTGATGTPMSIYHLFEYRPIAE